MTSPYADQTAGASKSKKKKNKKKGGANPNKTEEAATVNGDHDRQEEQDDDQDEEDERTVRLPVDAQELQYRSAGTRLTPYRSELFNHTKAMLTTNRRFLLPPRKPMAPRRTLYLPPLLSACHGHGHN